MEMQRRRLGLYPKVMALMVGLAVVPLGIAGYQLIAINQRGVQGAVLELQTKTAEALAEEVSASLAHTDDKVQFTLAALSQNLDWGAKQALLRSFLESHPGATQLAILGPDGRELLKVYDPGLPKPELASHADDPVWKDYAASRARKVELRPGSPVPSLRLYYPLGDKLGFFVAMDLRAFWERTQKVRVGGSGYGVLVDREGRPVVYPESLLDPAGRAAFPKQPLVRQAVRALSVGAGDFKDALGRELVAAYAPVPGLGAAAVVVQPKREAYAAVFEMRRQAAWGLLFFALLAGLISFGAARRLTRPILALTRGASAIAAGNFDVSVDSRTNDELHDLSDAFNSMARRLKEYEELHVERLLAEQRKTEAILFSIADGIIMTDYQGRVQLANRSARAALGLGEGDAVEGRSIRELLPDAAAGALIAEALAHPEQTQLRELDVPGAERRVYQVTARNVQSPGRAAPIGVLAALHDVTLEKEIEKLKETFLHGMTHDLRSPMASIRGFIELLLKGEPGEINAVQRKMLESMDKASYRLLGMINNMLDMAKMKAGKMSVALAPDVSLRELAERTLEVIEPLSKRKGIALTVTGDGSEPIQADPDLLERVFTNLLSNAIKFTPDGGRISVEFSRKGSELEAAVADDGEGIPDSVKGELFGLFAQGKGQKAGGTGLGLAICKFIVEAHKGRIWAESASPKGTRFVFTIPMDLAETADGDIVRRPKVGEGAV